MWFVQNSLLSQFSYAMMAFFWILSSQAAQLPVLFVDDLKHEIQEADFISYDSEKRLQIIEKLDQLFPVNMLEAFQYIHQEFQGELPHFRNNYAVTYLVGKKSKSLTQLTPLEKIKLNGSHAIHDLNAYSQNRIGHGTAHFLKQAKAEILILALKTDSPIEALTQVLEPIKWTVLPIPSLYEHWGIQKFYVHSATDSRLPKVVWIIPPSIQYLQHYVNTFGLYLKKKVTGFYDHQSAKNFRNKIAKEAKLEKSPQFKVDYLIFGYQKVWEKYLTTELKAEILEQQKIEIPSTQSNIHYFKVKSPSSPTGTMTLGLFSTHSTVWGELINTFMPSYFHPQLKGVIFMGSAGSLDPQIKIYDLSVPASFVRSGKKLKLTNLLSSLEQTDVQVSLRHGNTFSPVQQNLEYLKMLISQNIKTIDVEQSLLAEAVEDFNRFNQTNIKFGAINLITDQPYHAVLGKAEVSGLDQYDPEKKQKSRLKAVQFVFKSLSQEAQSPASCRQVISVF